MTLTISTTWSDNRQSSRLLANMTNRRKQQRNQEKNDKKNERDEEMKHERYIINEEEIELLDRYEGTMAQEKDPYRYDSFPAQTLASFCRMKDKSNDIFFKRYQAAKEVIDIIARVVGIDPDDTSFWIYSPEVDGTSPIAKRIDEWTSRSGEKAQLKKRLQELEQENALLRSLIQK